MCTDVKHAVEISLNKGVINKALVHEPSLILDVLKRIKFSSYEIEWCVRNVEFGVD